MKKIMASWIFSVLALVGLLVWLGIGKQAPAPESDSLSKGLIKGDFSLVDGTGRAVTKASFHGKYLLVYFGYTHCPDICPTSLLVIENALHHLGDYAKEVQPIFITIDPERDTPKVMGDYIRNFGGDLVGLTGTPEQIHQAAENYKVYYSKVEDKKSATRYSVDHSGFIYLMDKNGNYLAHFPHNVPERELEEGIRAQLH